MSSFDLGPVGGYDKFFKPAPEVSNDNIEGLSRELAPAIRDGKEAGVTFEDSLAESIGTLTSLSKDVDSKYKSLVLGEDVELHDVMLAANKSEVMFNLMLEVRNKLVEAWEKLSRSAV